MVDRDQRRLAHSHDCSRRPHPAAIRAVSRYRVTAALVLTALAGSILVEQPWTLSFRDALYWLVVASMIRSRCREARASSAPDDHYATARGGVSYAVGLLLIAAAVWTIAQCRWVAVQDPARLVDATQSSARRPVAASQPSWWGCTRDAG